MELRSLARSHKSFDGAVTFWMMPYITYAASHALEAMEAVWYPPQPEPEAEPRAERTSAQTIYLAAPHCTVDIEFGDNLPVLAQALQMYWQARTGDVAENYERFQMLPNEVVNIWWDAYLATRDNSIYANGTAPEVEAEDVEGEAEAASD